MQKSDLELIGSHYRAITRAKLSLYQLAEGVAGTELHITTIGEECLDGLDELTDFQIGLMLATDWGMPIPDGWLATHIPVDLMRPEDSVH